MKEQETVECSYLVNYLTGDCTEWERAAFERHLRTCVTCREELSELQEVWQALPFEMEEVEVPADLKGQVMQSIALEPSRKRRSFAWMYGLTAVIAFGIVVGIVWNYNPFTRSKEMANDMTVKPAEVVTTFELKSADTSMPSASGTAWVVKHGDMNKVVVNLSGLNETQGDWTYQVWLNHNGRNITAVRFMWIKKV